MRLRTPAGWSLRRDSCSWSRVYPARPASAMYMAEAISQSIRIASKDLAAVSSKSLVCSARHATLSASRRFCWARCRIEF